MASSQGAFDTPNTNQLQCSKILQGGRLVCSRGRSIHWFTTCHISPETQHPMPACGPGQQPLQVKVHLRCQPGASLAKLGLSPPLITTCTTLCKVNLAMLAGASRSPKQCATYAQHCCGACQASGTRWQAAPLCHNSEQAGVIYSH